LLALDLAEGGHPAQADSVLNDPKQLAVRITLDVRGCEFGGSRVHPFAHRGLGMAVRTMAHAAFQSVKDTSAGDAGFYICRWRRNSAATSAMDEEVPSSVSYERFQTARFLKGRQIETHQQNSNYNHHHYENRNRPG
jgi:hypothetical protein